MPVYGLNVPYPEIPDEVCSGGICRPELGEWCDWHNPDIEYEYEESDIPGEIGNF